MSWNRKNEGDDRFERLYWLKKKIFLEDLAEDEEAKVDISLARHFIDIYLASKEGLKKLGILRSESVLSGDYAEYLVAKFLNLSLMESTIEKGVDAVDDKGTTYQIKSRKCTDPNITHPSSMYASFDFNNIDDEFDYMIGVLFDYALNVMAIIKVSYEAVKEMGNQTNTTFRLYWNQTNLADDRFERLFWLPFD